MAMQRFVTGYETLCRVQVLHRYFLNFGATPFDLASPTAAQQKSLALVRGNYDISRFWRIVPDPATQLAMRNGWMVFKNLPDGFRVGVMTAAHEPVVPLADDLTLVFAIYQADAYFPLYTDLDRTVLDGLAKQSRVFRWRNVPGSLHLNADETIRPADLEARPATTDLGSGRPIGFIEVQHRPADGNSLLDEIGQVQDLAFAVVLRNRSTQWEYRATNLGQFPLVHYGRIGVAADSTPLPNPTPATTTDRGTQFVSTIY